MTRTRSGSVVDLALGLRSASARLAAVAADLRCRVGGHRWHVTVASYDYDARRLRCVVCGARREQR